MTETLMLLRETANDRFKARFGERVWGSVIVATALHFAVFAFFPTLSAEDSAWTPAEMEAIELPPELDIPPPPEAIRRPALPVASDVALDDVTIAPTTPEYVPPDVVAPPPARDVDPAAPYFTPMEVRPRILNQTEVEQALARNYPPLLRDVGIGGTVHVWFRVDETGAIVSTQLHQGSGYEALDRAALKVAEIIRLSPAQNRGENVAVWVSLPIRFTAN